MDVRGIADALVQKARLDLARARAEDAARPIGERRLDLFFYDTSDGRDYMDIHERRWCVALVKWTGTEWKRYRRISGPLPLEKALRRADEEAKRRGLERNT